MSDIPLVDLAAQHAFLRGEISNELARLMERGSFILGEPVLRFEEAFASFSGAAHCVGVANGTDALELALRAIGVGPGDEVLVPANTFVATALAVARAGATPAFADCDERYHLIDVDDAARRITEHTRAIIPVHLYGQMASMDAVADLAERHGLAIVEDAAQAHGATQKEAPPASQSRAATYSFYPSKNLGAYGDAGAVTTNGDELAAQVRALRNYGSDTKYEHPVPGFNSRLDALQAAILSIKLGHVAGWNDARRAAASRYDELLGDVDGVEIPETMPGNTHVWHLYVVRVRNRDRVLRALIDDGIGAGIHYPKPLHLQGAFAGQGCAEGDFPVAEAAAAEILSLPLYPEITDKRLERVANALRSALA